LKPSPQVDRAPSPRVLLERYGLQAKKSWGQNFLVDPGVQARIVAGAGLSSDDVALEIGAGLGALTGHLLAQAGRVIAVERDPDMIHVLRAEFAQRATLGIKDMDALELDFAALSSAAGRPLVVVGNLPYQITTPLLFGITDAAARGQVIARAVLMVQREFAERVVAAPGSKTYGRLSVMVQQQAAVQMLFHVNAGAFHPRPAVTSTVFRLVPRAQPLAPVRDDALFAAVVRAAFATRRKMLRRALAPAFGELAVPALARAEIDETRRAEELDVAAFARLANAIADEGGTLPDQHA
jgi:16S rRNA (adenine1518-N6/adenine1519-N6)-dimethyltransferase